MKGLGSNRVETTRPFDSKSLPFCKTDFDVSFRLVFNLRAFGQVGGGVKDLGLIETSKHNVGADGGNTGS